MHRPAASHETVPKRATERHRRISWSHWGVPLGAVQDYRTLAQAPEISLLQRRISSDSQWCGGPGRRTATRRHGLGRCHHAQDVLAGGETHVDPSASSRNRAGRFVEAPQTVGSSGRCNDRGCETNTGSAEASAAAASKVVTPLFSRVRFE